MGIGVPAYVGAIATDEPARAYAAIELRAALLSVCPHICQRHCEDVCVRTGWERPMGINTLKPHFTQRREVTLAAKAPGWAQGGRRRRRAIGSCGRSASSTQLLDRVIFAAGQRVDLEGLGPGGVFGVERRLR